MTDPSDQADEASASEPVEDRLDSPFDRYTIGSKIHDVPPHEVYEVSVDGRRAIYKGNTGRTGRAGIEGRVISFIGAETGVPVPEILCTGSDYFVAAWHPDAPTPADAQAADPAWAAAAGKGLARLHADTAADIDAYGQFTVEDDALATSGHENWHAAALEYVETYRPTLERYGHADMAAAVSEYLAENPAAFDGAGTAVCCHGWATPEHVAVAEGEVVCMVDFEHALAAPAEFDYWRTVIPTFSSLESDEPEKAFRAGYESVRSLPDGMERRRPLYGLLNAIYFFESLYVQDQHGPDAEAERASAFRDRITDTLQDLD